jgi:hypothetical protein
MKRNHGRGKAGNPKRAEARSYSHPEARTLLRPDVGTQAQFRKKKPPRTYRYDSSLSPALEYDGQNPAREVGEWLLSLEIHGLRDALEALPARRRGISADEQELLSELLDPMLYLTVPARQRRIGLAAMEFAPTPPASEADDSY